MCKRKKYFNHKNKAGFSSQNNPGGNVQSYNVKRVVVHPNYNSLTFDYDVALIEIDGTFSFNTCVKPVKLISSQNAVPEATGNKVRVSGWGWTVPNQRTSSANQLQSVDVSIISNQKAGKQLDISYPAHPKLTQRMIATGANGTDRKGACHGDSGGPLVFKQTGQNDIQIGIVGWGVENCVGGKNSPTIYTRLSKLVGWVNAEVWNNIAGDDQVCYNSSKVFTLQSSAPDFINVTWEVSSNVSILSSNKNTATIEGTLSNYIGDGWVKATLSNGVSLQKGFKIGVPSLGSLSIHAATARSGIYLFSKTWQEIFGFGDGEIEWKILGTSTMIRNCGEGCIHVYPTSTNHGQIITIGIRAKNECGYSSWLYKNFTIYSENPNRRTSIMH